jgi:hypothetical protein
VPDTDLEADGVAVIEEVGEVEVVDERLDEAVAVRDAESEMDGVEDSITSRSQT